MVIRISLCHCFCWPYEKYKIFSIGPETIWWSGTKVWRASRLGGWVQAESCGGYSPVPLVPHHQRCTWANKGSCCNPTCRQIPKAHGYWSLGVSLIYNNLIYPGVLFFDPYRTPIKLKSYSDFDQRLVLCSIKLPPLWHGHLVAGGCCF